LSCWLFVDLVNIFKESNQIFVSLILCLVFFGLDLIDLSPDIYDFSPSAGLGFGLFLFFLGD
jgi:hypothetical protein